MIAAWMLYLLILSGLLGIAALSAERALRWLNRPVRATWSLALVGAPVLALIVARTGGLGRFGGDGVLSPGPAAQINLVEADPTSALGTWASSVADFVLHPLVAVWEVIQASAGALDRPLLYLWGAASTAVLLALLVSMRRLYVTSRDWPRRRVDGSDVRVSEGLGPAVLGIGRAEVVLPSWVLEQDAASRRLIVLHESEHLKARDGTLLFAGLLMAAAIPWNPFAWWQLRRLRLAVELDCDRRVLRSGVELREYASLLLEAGSRRAVPFGSTAAFVHFDSQLGRRIRMMMENRKAPRYVPAAVALTMAAAILIVACTAPSPMETDEVGVAEQAPQVVAGKIVQKLRDGGTWTAHVEGSDDSEVIDLEFGEEQNFVFKSDKGTLHLSQDGELREISKQELGEMFGHGERGIFELHGVSEEPDGTWTLEKIETGHLELAPDFEKPDGTWTLEDGGTVSLELIEKKESNRVRSGP